MSSSESHHAVLALEGPIWLDGDMPWANMFGGKRDPDRNIGFIGGTAELARGRDPAFAQMADGPAPQSRAIPLYLAEHFHFLSDAHITTLIPWDDTRGGPYYQAPPWSDAELISLAKDEEHPVDYLIVTHIQAQMDPWRLHIRILRSADEKFITDLFITFPSARPAKLFPELPNRIEGFLRDEGVLEDQIGLPSYQAMPTDTLTAYLLRMEQSLSIRCSTLGNLHRPGFSNPNDIIDGILHICKWNPDHIPSRALLVYALYWLKEYRDALVHPFRDKVSEFWRAHPLPANREAAFFEALREVFPPQQA